MPIDPPFRRRAGFVLFCAALVAAASACAPPPPDDLQRAVAAAQYMASPRWLSRTAFLEFAPADPKPSDFVRYVFSDFGVAEWPVAFDELEEEQLQAIHSPVLPRSVALLPDRPSLEHGRQVVLRADDQAGVLHIEAYEHAQGEPVMRVEQRILFDLVKRRRP